MKAKAIKLRINRKHTLSCISTTCLQSNTTTKTKEIIFVTKNNGYITKYILLYGVRKDIQTFIKAKTDRLGT